MTAYDPLARIASEPDALEAFYRDHVEAVQRFVAKRVSDPHLAADLTADVFLAAMDSAHSYDPAAGPSSRGCTASAATRSPPRPGGGPVSSTPPGGSRAAGCSTVRAWLRIEERLDAERDSRRLYRAMADLSDDDRALLELVALDGLSVADAARVLGVKPGTARVRLHRSRARVTASLPTLQLEVHP